GEGQAGARLAQRVEGRKRGADAGVVGNLAVVEGDVVVDPHEDPRALQVLQVTDGAFRHVQDRLFNAEAAEGRRGPPRSVVKRSQPRSREAMYRSRSFMRFEKPHSLSYREKPLA